MVEIIRVGDIPDQAPVCSRCGMAYGTWELTVQWNRAEEVKVFWHRPGCRWTIGKNRMDFGPQLRDTGIVPNNANIIRLH
jgi:hypothetical protein